MDNRQATLCIFIDFRKAFDTICHTKLVKKLNQLKINGHALALLANYLQHRKHHTSLNNTKSDPMNITYGVPQGSVLGPILFTLFINDITSVVHNSEICLFADDMALLCSDKNILQAEYKIQADLDRVHERTKRNTLTINVKKTQYKIFSCHQNKYKNLPQRIIIMLYKSLILPHFDYANII